MVDVPVAAMMTLASRLMMPMVPLASRVMTSTMGAGTSFRRTCGDGRCACPDRGGCSENARND
jgi:hypothetical protein